MDESSLLTDLLQQAGEVFSRAGELARALQEERESSSPKRDRVRGRQFAAMQEAFCAAVRDVRGATQNPPDGFEPVARRLEEAAQLAQTLQAAGEGSDDLDCFPSLNTVCQAGWEAIRQVAREQPKAAPLATTDVPAAPARDGAAPPPAPKKAKRSSARGEGRAKLIAALTKHHRYAEESCLNQEPIGNNALARLAGVSESTASTFFQREFGGRRKYRTLCRDGRRLAIALKLLNQEFSPRHLPPADPLEHGFRKI